MLQTDAREFPEIDAAEQAARGFRWLRFAPGLEAAYRAHQRAAGLPQLRIALVLGFAFGFSLLALDYLLGDTGFSSERISLLFIINQSVVLATLGATFLRPLQPRLGLMGVLVALNLAVSSLFVNPVGQTGGIGLPTTGFVIVTFYTYFFLGLRFWPAVATATSIFIAVMVTAFTRDANFGVVLYDGLFLLFANLIGATCLYSSEYDRRLSFLEARKLQTLAGSDPLTGLANRSTFETHLDLTWRNCKRTGDPLTVAMVDVDFFKKYNDHYGHQAGDRCLQRVALLVAELGSRPLDLAARYGGEEFVLVLPGCTAANARERLQTLLYDIEDLGIEHAASGVAPVVTISAGVAQICPADTQRSPDGLLQMADEALYSAKQHGRNQVVVTTEEANIKTGAFKGNRLRVAG